MGVGIEIWAVGAGEGRAEEGVEAAVSYCFVATHGGKWQAVRLCKVVRMRYRAESMAHGLRCRQSTNELKKLKMQRM